MFHSAAIATEPSELTLHSTTLASTHFCPIHPSKAVGQGMVCNLRQWGQVRCGCHDSGRGVLGPYQLLQGECGRPSDVGVVVDELL